MIDVLTHKGKIPKSRNVSQPSVCYCCITENYSFPFTDCTDSEFVEVTDVNANDNYSKSFKTNILNASELNLVYGNKIRNDTELTFNNDTDQDSSVWSQLSSCRQYIPSRDADIILCDKECSDNNFIV